MSTLEHTRRRRRHRVVRPVAVLFAATSAIVAMSVPPALAEDPAPDSTTTTVPDPDPTTTLPDEHTTTTTLPEPDTTDSTTTTSPPETTTPEDPAEHEHEHELDAGEALVCNPEFGALTPYQRALVQELQRSTDAYALRRVALADIVEQLASSKDALDDARTRELTAAERELFSVTAVLLSTDGVDGPAVEFGALTRRLERERLDARSVRLEAKAEFAAASARVSAAVRVAADASDARAEAESAVERELGPGAIRARPDDITELLVVEQAGQPAPTVIGGFRESIPGAVLSSPFGLRNDPLCGGAGFHAGVDLAAAHGTPIQAAAAGRVVRAGDCGGYGFCVVIDHGEHLATVSGHQSEVFVDVGDQVDAGQIIGLVGSTGKSTGPHLHLEVRLYGLAVDPVLAVTR